MCLETVTQGEGLLFIKISKVFTVAPSYLFLRDFLLFIKICCVFLNLLLNRIPSYETFFCSFCFICQFFWIRFHSHCSDSCVLKVRLYRTLSLTNVLREVFVLLVPLRKLSVLLGPLEQIQVTQPFHSFNKLQLSMI